jgi:hypothetical protein
MMIQETLEAVASTPRAIPSTLGQFITLALALFVGGWGGFFFRGLKDRRDARMRRR